MTEINHVSKELSKMNPQPHMEHYDTFYAAGEGQFAQDVEWFDSKHINAAYNAVERHAKGRLRNKVALIYHGSDDKIEKFTYLDLHNESSRFANVLKKLGVMKGDRVFLFMPRVPSVYATFLGTLKLGAVASTLFGAFGPEALLDRLGNSEAKVVITSPSLKPKIDQIKDKLPNLTYVIVVGGTPDHDPAKGGSYPIVISYEKEMKDASKKFECVKTNKEDLAFMLYTSGTTGKSKGVVHAHAGIVHHHATSKYIHDLHEEDIYWCTADHGWVTGIIYGILGPLSNGATLVQYEGRFDPEKWYEALEKHQVTIWYTAPTAIRMLMKAGDELPKRYDFSHLRHIYSVGEPLNPEAIRWGLKAFNGLAFHDTWWQTETGGMLIVNYPSMPIKLGSMGKPFPGITASVIDDHGKELPADVEGNLAIKQGWVSMMRGIWKNEEKYKSLFTNGWYVTGDRAKKDKDGYFWYIGRADDVIKTSGERVGPFEVESVLVEHPAIAEAGVIGKPDPVRGEIIKAILSIREGQHASPELEEDIQKFVKTRLAAHAYPREIAFVKTLPKTRSGKIMRRVLKCQELGLPVGDLSTLEND